ncbi:MAG: 50S ribosomal protein L5 [Planctomycetota bacterium]
MTNLSQKYKSEIIPAMVERFGYKNSLAVPRLQKIVLSTGVGSGDNKDRLPQALEDLSLVTGQKAVETKARKSVAAFKLREGMSVGARVTLRGPKMYEFLERLIGVAIPRFRDFRGLSDKSFDGHGDYTFGIAEQAVFPEIDPDKVKVSQGMHVTLVTSAKTDDEGRELLRLFGMPFATT